MHAVLYARYSSELQRDASIEDQVRVCRARAEREGWTVIQVYTDHAISGSTTLRPGYQALLGALRLGGIDVVLAESLDRFSRDQEHIAGFFKQVMFAGTRIVTLAEGDISELHIGLKGTMGALYLKDLAQKTHRGIEGRIRQGRASGLTPYGYNMIRSIGPDGEPERGLRQVNPAEAAVVRRIFADYAVGMSPRRIARNLNADGVPGPSGGIWYDATIRGRPLRGDGLLRNALYVGQLVWNRAHRVKDPLTGTRHRRANDPATLVVGEAPGLQIIDRDLWERVQMRLERDSIPRGPVTAHPPPSHDNPFWERRRPKHLLTGKVVCGACGALFTNRGKNYLGCRHGREGACPNLRLIRRDQLQDHVVEMLRSRMMIPDLMAEFVSAFTDEWNRLIAEHGAAGLAQSRELQQVKNKIAHLIDALSDGFRSTDLKSRLNELETRRAILEAECERDTGPVPALHPNLALIYRDRVARLQEALQGPDATEAVEAARALVDRVIVSPPQFDDDPPGIQVVGELAAMLRAAGVGKQAQEVRTPSDRVLHAFVSSIKAAPGGQRPPGQGPG